MMKKIMNYMNQYHMISTGDTVVVGVSGGADSVCLLLVLKQMSKEMDFLVRAVHVNHGIREEAGEDAAYVAKLCADLGVPLRLVQKNVKELAVREQLSEEEAGRKVRYRALEEALSDCPFEKGKIAVAHHKNDRAETVLFHLFRGTGIVGLSGIRPVRDRIIRPLLCLDRTEIEAYLEKRNIEYCTDQTNHEDNYTRNKIRHHIVSYAEKEICVQAVEHINAAAQRLEETELFLQNLTEKAYEAMTVQEEDCISVAIESFRKEEKLIGQRVILKVLERLIPCRRDITSTHVGAVLTLFEKEGNREICLPKGIYAWRQYKVVHIGPRRKDAAVGLRAMVQAPGDLELGDGSKFVCSIFPYDHTKNIIQKTYTKWFDYDRIIKSLVLRTRQTGDFLTVDEKMSHKSLKEYMIAEKIPRLERETVPVLAEENHILWVVGYRISAYYKVRPNTKNILQVEYTGGTKDV